MIIWPILRWLLIPLYFISLSAVVPYFLAMLYRLSPCLTLYDVACPEVACGFDEDVLDVVFGLVLEELAVELEVLEAGAPPL